MTPLKKALVGAGIAGVAAVTIALAGPSIASAADPSPEPSSTSSANSGANQGQDFAAALAAELGLDEATVKAALDKVRADHPGRGHGGAPPQGAPQQGAPQQKEDLTDRLDAAVVAGTITQEEADAVKKVAEAGVLKGPHR